jgi:uncharacterized protein YprB with RNaseH-like and TPR domain
MDNDLKPKPWSKTDIEVLAMGHEKGISYTKIGAMLGRTTDSIRNKAFSMGLSKPTGVPWYSDLRIATWDIETTNLKANAGTILSWALKPLKGAVISDCVTREEMINCKFDERIVGTLLEALQNFDAIITYYGTGFDVPFLKTRALMMGMEPPGPGELYHWDCYYPVKYRMKLHRSSLDAACAAFGIKGKTHLDMEIWMKARQGDPDSLKYVFDHNKADVRILAQLWEKIRGLQKWQRRPF